MNVRYPSRLRQEKVFDEAVKMAPGMGGRYGRASPVAVVVIGTDASALLGILSGTKVNS